MVTLPGNGKVSGILTQIKLGHRLHKGVMMPLGNFVEADTTPKPLPIGRTARLVFAVGTGFYFVWNLMSHPVLVSSDIPISGFWIGVAFAWWYFSDLVVVGFSLKWGRWPQVALLPIAGALSVANLIAFGSLWSPLLAWSVFGFVEFFYGSIAISSICRWNSCLTCSSFWLSIATASGAVSVAMMSPPVSR